MCLDINKVLTAEHSKLKTNKVFTFYKLFSYTSKKNILITPFQFWPVPLTTNFIKAQGKLAIFNSTIDGGVIHAYQTKNKISCTCSTCFKPNDIFIPITVYADDIVAFGSNDVCFFRFKFKSEILQYIENVRNKKDIVKIYPNKTRQYD